MSATTLQELRAESAEIADRTHPLHVIDTVILAVLVAIGWSVGRAWWLLVFGSVFAAKGLKVYALAVRHGYRMGAMTLQPAVQSSPGPAPGPAHATQQMLDDERITDYQTPFGVPFGPNVQAYSEPANAGG